MVPSSRLVAAAAVVVVVVLVATSAVAYVVAWRNADRSLAPVVAEPTPQPAPGTTGPDDCVIGGCSGELCTDANDEPAFSTCIYREEFACYTSSTCERQGNGQCGWTQTTELKACLENPPAIQ